MTNPATKLRTMSEINQTPLEDLVSISWPAPYLMFGFIESDTDGLYETFCYHAEDAENAYRVRSYVDRLYGVFERQPDGSYRLIPDSWRIECLPPSLVAAA